MTLAPTSLLLVASLLTAHPSSPTPVPTPDLRRSLQVPSTYLAPQSVRAAQTPALPAPALAPARERSVVRSLLGAVLGFGAGAVVGGLIGSKLEPACYCDDPGLAGFVYGGWTGGVAGAITLGYFLGR